jgi:hypothetical protein
LGLVDADDPAAIVDAGRGRPGSAREADLGERPFDAVAQHEPTGAGEGIVRRGRERADRDLAAVVDLVDLGARRPREVDPGDPAAPVAHEAGLAVWREVLAHDHPAGTVEQGRLQQRRGDPSTATGLLRLRRLCSREVDPRPSMPSRRVRFSLVRSGPLS